MLWVAVAELPRPRFLSFSCAHSLSFLLAGAALQLDLCSSGEANGNRCEAVHVLTPLLCSHFGDPPEWLRSLRSRLLQRGVASRAVCAADAVGIFPVDGHHAPDAS